MEYTSNYHMMDFLYNYLSSPINERLVLTKQDIQNLLEEIEKLYNSTYFLEKKEGNL